MSKENLGVEKLNRDWCKEEIHIRRFGDRAFAVNISYWNLDVCSFIISNVGINLLYDTINTARKEEVDV